LNIEREHGIFQSIVCLPLSSLLWHKKKPYHHFNSSPLQPISFLIQLFHLRKHSTKTMLPLPGPLNPGGRKSPFPEPSDTKRRRVSDSPRPPFSSHDVMMNPRASVPNRYPSTPGTPMERHLYAPAMDLTYQPSGPDQDVSWNMPPDDLVWITS
jgi:hypothetical protein